MQFTCITQIPTLTRQTGVPRHNLHSGDLNELAVQSLLKDTSDYEQYLAQAWGVWCSIELLSDYAVGNWGSIDSWCFYSTCLEHRCGLRMLMV